MRMFKVGDMVQVKGNFYWSTEHLDGVIGIVRRVARGSCDVYVLGHEYSVLYEDLTKVEKSEHSTTVDMQKYYVGVYKELAASMSGFDRVSMYKAKRAESDFFYTLLTDIDKNILNGEEIF